MYNRDNCIWLIRDKEFETLNINNPYEREFQKEKNYKKKT